MSQQVHAPPVPAGSSRLAVTRLTLSDFRCYRFLRLETDDRPVVLTGPNGAGKTNVIEALSFLAPGRGLRRARLSEAARQGAGEGAAWAVAARIERPDGSGEAGPVEIGTGREAGTERRVVRLDGQPARTQGALAEVLGVLWLTPPMDRLFQEAAAGRRRFLDRLTLGLDPTHAARATAYERALRERARLLKEGRFDPAWLAVLEETMAAQGTAMAAARNATVAALNAACAQGVGPFPAAALALDGAVEGWLEAASPPEAEERLKRTLAKSRRRDAEAGSAIIGPHRTDLKVRHAGKDMPVEQCSTGEQKAVLISIVLAQARVRAGMRGQAPILLLDEVAAHMDGDRRAALFDELCALGAQSWLTGTDEALFAEFGQRAQFLRVRDAVVERSTGNAANE